MSDQPEGKPTVSLPAVPEWAIELTKSVKGGFQSVNARLDAQEMTLSTVSAAGVDTNTRLERVEGRIVLAESRLGDVEGRIGRTSTRVRESVATDMEHDAQLAAERAAREELAAKVATKDDVLKLDKKIDEVASTQTAAIVDGVKLAMTNPMVRNIAYAAGGAILAALATCSRPPLAPAQAPQAPAVVAPAVSP